MRRPTRRLTRTALTLTAGSCLAAACEIGPGPWAGDDEGLAFGHPDSVLLWTPEQQRAGFPRYDRLFHTRLIPASTRPLPLPGAGRTHAAGALATSEDREPGADLAARLDDLTYVMDATELGVEDFLERNHIRGVMMLHEGAVVLERYAEDHTSSTRWVSYSIAKSVVSMLVGAALEDGHIESLDEPVTRYLPVLEGSGYEGVSIRDVLRMSSGVAWNEDYDDPESDVSREIDYDGEERLLFLSSKPRVAEPGTRFNYSTGEIYLVGSVVHAAVGESLSAYLHRKIWEPFGMEADANWMLVEWDGPEYAGCCISATLPDYARLGLFALRGGVLPDGERVLPEGWMEDSTTPSPTNPGYGYLWWIHEDGSFSARGIFGQLIHVDPELDLVVAMHGIWPEPTSDALSAERDAFLAAVKEAVRESLAVPGATPVGSAEGRPAELGLPDP